MKAALRSINILVFAAGLPEKAPWREAGTGGNPGCIRELEGLTREGRASTIFRAGSAVSIVQIKKQRLEVVSFSCQKLSFQWLCCFVTAAGHVERWTPEAQALLLSDPSMPPFHICKMG